MGDIFQNNDNGHLNDNQVEKKDVGDVNDDDGDDDDDNDADDEEADIDVGKHGESPETDESKPKCNLEGVTIMIIVML